jgi:SSS family solute:Na+ symporter
MGAFRLLVDTPVTLGLEGYKDGYTAGSFLWIINNIYFQYFSLLIFLVCVFVMIAVSYVTEPPDDRRLHGLTFATVSDEQKAVTRASWDKRDVLASGAVLILILVAYLYFQG